MSSSKSVIIDRHPGRSSQTIGIARELGTEIDLIHEPSVGVVGNKGDSQCYIGVQRKVEAIHEALRAKIGHGEGQMAHALVQPEYTVATSDGIRNGTREMRYSLIGREVTQDSVCEHLSASGLAGTIAVVACDKPPVGTLAALLEHNQPAIIMSDGSIRPAIDPEPTSRWTLSPPIRSPAATTRNKIQHRLRMPARAMAAAAACSPTTPCRPLSAWSACSRCIWWPPRPTIPAGWRNSPRVGRLSAADDAGDDARATSSAATRSAMR